VRNKKGEKLSTQEQLKRWTEYFSEILNKNKGKQVQEEVLMETMEHDVRINLHPPTHTEVRSSLKQIKHGKAPGMGITTEVLKVDIETTIDLLQPMLEKISNKEKVPTEWKESLIIKIPKKGDITSCNNW
jgi:hypothetical protein